MASCMCVFFPLWQAFECKTTCDMQNVQVSPSHALRPIGPTCDRQVSPVWLQQNHCLQHTWMSQQYSLQCNLACRKHCPKGRIIVAKCGMVATTFDQIDFRCSAMSHCVPTSNFQIDKICNYSTGTKKKQHVCLNDLRTFWWQIRCVSHLLNHDIPVQFVVFIQQPMTKTVKECKSQILRTLNSHVPWEQNMSADTVSSPSLSISKPTINHKHEFCDLHDTNSKIPKIKFN